MAAGLFTDFIKKYLTFLFYLCWQFKKKAYNEIIIHSKMVGNAEKKESSYYGTYREGTVSWECPYGKF